MKHLTTLSLLAAAAIATPAAAGELTGITWFSGVASVAGEAVPPADSPNNDNVVGDSDNEIYILQKDYFGIGPVDIVIDVINSGGTTEYIVIEGVQNSTGLDWDGYHIELGFGTGGSFVKSTPGDGLDFDGPDYDSTADFNPGGFFFPTVTRPTEDDLVASGGIQPDFAYAGNFIFHVDVPDGISQFTIRQSPLPVPEPGSALALVAMAGVISKRRRYNH
jgi:hypothetical protein